jgi:hypothetical protein
MTKKNACEYVMKQKQEAHNKVDMDNARPEVMGTSKAEVIGPATNATIH